VVFEEHKNFRLGRDRAKRTLAPDRMQVIENDRYRTTVRNQAVHQLVHGRFDPAPRSPRDIGAGPPGPRPNRSTAVARCVHNRTGSSSAASSVNQNDGLPALDTPQPQESRLTIANRRVDHRQRGTGVTIDGSNRRGLRNIPG
jgi:hypothetical protein